jgi:hypothetical protein
VQPALGIEVLPREADREVHRAAGIDRRLAEGLVGGALHELPRGIREKPRRVQVVHVHGVDRLGGLRRPHRHLERRKAASVRVAPLAGARAVVLGQELSPSHRNQVVVPFTVLRIRRPKGSYQ